MVERTEWVIHMDLHRVDTYLHPQTLSDVADWQPGWAWLAGGTWLFTEPQPQLRTLVDMQPLGWDELTVSSEGLAIGAMCVMRRLLDCTVPADWSGIAALRQGVHELASFKVQNVATIAGNLCLALPAGTFAPVMVLLEAEYELWPLNGTPYRVPAADFQTGAKQTRLHPGDVLRMIYVPAQCLKWHTSYHRICLASAGLAIAIVTAAYSADRQQVRFCIGAAASKPYLITADGIPTPDQLGNLLDAQFPHQAYLTDECASADYRRHVTEVLMRRSLSDLPIPRR
jgi:CO/xanthine dehydrogenase FAD-binding subunit